MSQDKTKLLDEVTKSNNAEIILNNEIFKESIQKLKDLYSQSLFKTGVEEKDTREKLWMAYQIVGKVEQHFKELVDTGKLAKKQLEDFRKSEQQQKF